MSNQLTPVLGAAVLMTLSASVAHADYYTGTPANCRRFTQLSAAPRAGEIFVRDLNIEPRATTIIGDTTLVSAMAPCVPGGAGRIQLAAGATARLLEVNPGTSLDPNDLILEGVSIEGGNITGDGGSIYLNPETSLTMRGAAIVQDGVATGRGGCIYADHSLITMEPGTSVTDCRASVDGGGIAIKGISAAGGYHLLHNLETNVATFSGGGVWVDAAPVCLFEATGNAAGLDGGAAYVTSASGAAWLGTFTTQSDNTATRDGGAVFITGSLASLDTVSTLRSNSATANGGGIRATAAAQVYLDSGTVIRENNAQVNGGGVHGDAAATVHLSGAASNPGAIGVGGEGPGAGACGTLGLDISISDNLAGYDANKARVSWGRDGGGVYLSNASLLGANATIARNIASDAGGGVGAFAGAVVTIDRVTFITNTAEKGNGGGLLGHDAATTIELGHSTFTENKAPLGGGGGVALVAATGTIGTSTLSANSALVGGGLGLNLAAIATVTDSDLTGNDAFTGGGLYTGAGSSLTMLTGSISSNTGRLGAGVVADGSTVILGDSPANGCPAGAPCVTLQANVASGILGRGGAILLMAPNANVQVRRSAIVDNAADEGCAIWMDRVDHTLFLHNTAIIDNHGNTGKVAAVTAGAGVLAMVNDTVAHNDTGIFLTSSTVSSISNSLVIQNSTDIGGLGVGVSITGSCNGVQSVAAQAAFVGASNVTTIPLFASVSASAATPGRPINTRDIVNQCSAILTVDILGLSRLVGSGDRGAYEQQ